MKQGKRWVEDDRESFIRWRKTEGVIGMGMRTVIRGQQ